MFHQNSISSWSLLYSHYLFPWQCILNSKEKSYVALWCLQQTCQLFLFQKWDHLDETEHKSILKKPIIHKIFISSLHLTTNHSLILFFILVMCHWLSLTKTFFTSNDTLAWVIQQGLGKLNNLHCRNNQISLAILRSWY